MQLISDIGTIYISTIIEYGMVGEALPLSSVAAVNAVLCWLLSCIENLCPITPSTTVVVTLQGIADMCECVHVYK